MVGLRLLLCDSTDAGPFHFPQPHIEETFLSRVIARCLETDSISLFYPTVSMPTALIFSPSYMPLLIKEPSSLKKKRFLK